MKNQVFHPNACGYVVVVVVVFWPCIRRSSGFYLRVVSKETSAQSE